MLFLNCFHFLARDYRHQLPLDSTKFPEILAVYNEIIEDNLPIIKDYSNTANQRRFWKIEGFAEVPCGGTHIASTSEVGYVNLKRPHPGRSLERIEITLVK